MEMLTCPGTFINRVYSMIVRSAQGSVQHMFLLGLLGTFGFPSYYFIWHDFFPQPYENLPVRLVGCLLCFLLVVKKYWPKKTKPLLPIYWYVTLLYVIPFFFNFMLLKNDLSVVWLMSALAGLFILILVVDWVWLAILFISGAILAWFAYVLTGGNPGLLLDYLGFMLIYLFMGIVGALFIYNTRRIEKEKLEGMASLSSNVAHELRTPLLGIRSGVVGLKRYLPMLFETYFIAKEKGLTVPRIRSSHFNNILPALERMESETTYANTIIDMLLMNVGRQAADPATFEVCSIVEVVENAIDRYPFNSAEEKALVHWDPRNAFQFMGSQLLMVHILFNLLKNALHFIVKAEKGDIHISLKQGHKFNQLCFKDTGLGISIDILPRLFERFFTTTLTGTGVGLSFCKMIMHGLGGDIVCRSEEDKYTEFILSFPKPHTKL